MSLEFKLRTSPVLTTGDKELFRTLHNTNSRANGGNARFSVERNDSMLPPNKLVFWGKGAEIAALLNEFTFSLSTEELSGLRMEVRWLPITKKGAEKMAVAALKAVAKDGAKVAAKAAVGAATHGVVPAIDLSEKAVSMAKTAFKAAKGEVELAPDNLLLDWELRIVLNGGPGAIDDVVKLTERSVNIGQRPNSGRVHAEFLELMGKYSASVRNLVLLVKGEPAYDRLYDEGDVVAALKVDLKKKQSTGSRAWNRFKEFIAEKLGRPSRADFQNLGVEEV